jgi:quercetin dioxygenase-like cupin family protein
MTEQSQSTYPFTEARRLISTHDPATGRAVFSNLPENPPVGEIPSAAKTEPSRNVKVYSTNTFPVGGLSPPSQVTPEEYSNLDFKAYEDELEHPHPPDGSNQTHTTCRVLEMAPGGAAPMHRTITFDYGVVIDGEVEWELDSGETRVLKKGDVCIQRGTAHAWKNVTPVENNNGWARMFFVMLASEKIRVKDGRELGYGFGLSRHGEGSNSPK